MKTRRYTCGNGEGMFLSKKGHFVEYSDSKKQLLRFAEWMKYHSKNKSSEQCVKDFLKSSASDH
jgi:hypothetical protein